VALLVVAEGGVVAGEFRVELARREAPAEAQARAATALNAPARAVGLRLTKRGGGTLDYRPRVQFPFLVMLWHYLNRERMAVAFAPGEAGGTRVTIAGKVARGKHGLAADPEHWEEALGRSMAGEPA
jgi:hypothetical protein